MRHDGRMDEVEIINEATIGDDGWARISPFGDYHGECITVMPDRTTRTRPAVQRMDRAAADVMVSRFNSPLSRLKRVLRHGLPIFYGHPDQPGRGDQYPDKMPKGLIADLEVRNDGLYARPVFNNDGVLLLETTAGLAFSPRWTAEQIQADPFILRPTHLLSAGLTTRPNLPNQAINETMDLTKLIAALLAVGITVPEGADLNAITAAVEAAKPAAASPSPAEAEAQQQAANERTAAKTARTELANARTELANARAAHATVLIDGAIRSGQVTEADRAGWVTQFANDFAKAQSALAAVKPTTGLKTTATASGATMAKATANIMERAREVQTLVNERMAKGETYDQAFNAVRAEKPNLFGKLA